MEEGIGYRVQDGLGHLTLDDGRANAMHHGWLVRLGVVLDEIEADDTHSVIVNGREGFFSGGLDLKRLPDLSPDALRETTTLFMESMRRCFLFPKPMVAAANGHCIAGGMMLYLSADLRLAVDRKGAQFGLNEATTGIPLLGGTAGICVYSIPQRHHTELILHGRMTDARGSFDRGVTHELVSDAVSLSERATARARDLADVDLTAYRLNKLILRSHAWNHAVVEAEKLSSQVPRHNLFEKIRR